MWPVSPLQAREIHASNPAGSARAIASTRRERNTDDRILYPLLPSLQVMRQINTTD